MAEKNMIEDTLFQIKNLEESLKKNAQGILSSTMRKEINSLVKESLMEQEEITTPAPEDVDAESPMLPDEEEGMDFAEPEMDAEEPMMMGDEMTGMEPEEDETIDMRGASDSEVIRVFKAMGDNDGVVVTRDNNIITLTDDDDEYIIKLNESMENYSMEKDLEEMFGSHEDYSFEDEEEEDEDMEDYSFEDEEDEDEMDMDMQEMYMDDMSSYDDEDEDEMEDFSFEDEDEDDMDEGIVYEIEMDDMKMSMDEEDDFMSMDDEDDFMNMDEEDDFMSLDSEYGEDEMYSYDDEEEDENLSEAKSMRQKSKGVGMGKGPKFKYGQVTGYKTTKQKEGTKGVGMGKAKFTYKDGENLDGEFRPIKSGKKVETKEASRTYGSGKSFGRGLPKPKAAPRHLKEEVIELRTKNGEYRKALDLFRTKLNEVAVFNSNLAYATRLFTEHSTTKQEKINILRRFDDVETLKESKNLYRVVKSELSNNSLSENVSITESLERTVNKTSTSGSAVNLIESKTYENPQFLRMKDLMTKL
tara:strand:- start:78 stop:1661 length:1584 start_codon:yes stop_codon:yes gene_type:complete